jgi:hypothetical protein
MSVSRNLYTSRIAVKLTFTICGSRPQCDYQRRR